MGIALAVLALVVIVVIAIIWKKRKDTSRETYSQKDPFRGESKDGQQLVTDTLNTALANENPSFQPVAKNSVPNTTISSDGFRNNLSQKLINKMMLSEECGNDVQCLISDTASRETSYMIYGFIPLWFNIHKKHVLVTNKGIIYAYTSTWNGLKKTSAWGFSEIAEVVGEDTFGKGGMLYITTKKGTKNNFPVRNLSFLKEVVALSGNYTNAYMKVKEGKK